MVGMVAMLVVIAVACRKDFDFDGDGKADKYYVDTNVGDWYRLNPVPAAPTFIAAGHGPWAPGDYDGDGTWEPAAVGGSTWWSMTAGDQTWARPAGATQSDLDMVQADYDGDGKTDPAWYQESIATWFIKGHDPIQFGATATNTGSGGSRNDQDYPVPADYDGDGKADLSTYNPRTAAWRIRSSKTGDESTSVIGTAGAWPAPADYDGDGKADRAVQSWSGVWTIEGQPSFTFGPGSTTTDLWYPTVADYDGDGKADASYVNFANSSTGSLPSFWHFRSSKDLSTTDELIPASGTNGAHVVPAQMDFDIIVQTARFTLAVRCAYQPATC